VSLCQFFGGKIHPRRTVGWVGDTKEKRYIHKGKVYPSSGGNWDRKILTFVLRTEKES